MQQTMKQETQKVIDELVTLDFNKFFVQPVCNEQYPDYLEVIECPMDFSQIYHKLNQDLYQNYSQVRSDVDQIWKNCETYNRLHNNKTLVSIGKQLSKKSNYLFNRLNQNYFQPQKVKKKIKKDQPSNKTKSTNNTNTINNNNNIINNNDNNTNINNDTNSTINNNSNKNRNKNNEGKNQAVDKENKEENTNGQQHQNISNINIQLKFENINDYLDDSTKYINLIRKLNQEEELTKMIQEMGFQINNQKVEVIDQNGEIVCQDDYCFINLDQLGNDGNTYLNHLYQLRKKINQNKQLEKVVEEQKQINDWIKNINGSQDNQLQ